MYALYRVAKPLCFTTTLIAKVLILGRMLSLISVGRSPRARKFVSRVEAAAVVFAVAASVVTSVLMWGSATRSFAAADAFARAASAAGNASAVAEALAVAKSKGDSSNEWNAFNNSFEVSFYALYASPPLILTPNFCIKSHAIKQVRCRLHHHDRRRIPHHASPLAKHHRPKDAS